MTKYAKTSAGLLAVWFVGVFSASSAHLFKNGSNRFGLGVAIAALAPVIVFSLWFAASDEFRSFAMSLNPKTLTSLHVGRIVGFSFVLLEARNVLPAMFAFPAGYGDMFIGATAGFAAWKLAEPAHRNSFVFWQALGILDLIAAVSLGTTAPLLSPTGPSMAAMTVLPLSLVPTFLVPLYLMLHIVCIAQARTWKAASEPSRQATRPLQHSAI